MLGSGVGGSGLAHVRAGGPCRAGARAEAHRLGGAQGWRRSGGGLCICCSKCNKVHFSLVVYTYEIGGNIFYIEILDSTLTLFVRTLIFEGF